MRGAAERRREVEPETGDPVGGHPVPQRIENELHHTGMIEVERVAATSAVDVPAPVAGIELVVARIVDAAERQGRAEAVGFRGVIVDDVEIDLDLRGRQFPDRRLEAADAVRAEVARLGREVVERRVAPEIGEAPLHEEAVIDEGLNR